MTNTYAVVDNRNEFKPDPTTFTTEHTYEAVPTENLYYNTVAATTDESAALHESYYTPMQSAVTGNGFSEKETYVHPELSTFEGKSNKQHHDPNRSKRTNIWLPACLIVLIMAGIAAALAAAVVFVLIAGLRSDLTAALKDSSSSSGSITENIHVPQVTNNLEPQLNMLRTDISHFTATINHQVESLNVNASNGIDDIERQINITCEFLKKFQDSIALLSSSVDDLGGSFSEQLNDVSNTSTAMHKRLKIEILETITNSSEIYTLQDKLANGVQTLHTFHSCEAVSNFSIQLPSGMYNIRAGNSSIIEYCSNIIAFSCHGIPGRWRRIAYLSNNTSPVKCPMGFESINDPNVPALCKRNPTGSRCSSITYSTNRNSYSQVCGTIHGSYFGEPDGLNSYTSVRSRSAGTPLNGNYVDGISLTHGSMYEHHIWTLSAIVNFATNPTDVCSICDDNKPSYVGMDYSCDVVERCNGNCSPRQIWGSGQCIGNNTFYKNLMQPTSDDIEMRVCVDQAENDEDIFLSFIELYVM